MRKNNCDIGTLAALIKNKDEIINPNVVKVQVDKDLKSEDFFAKMKK